RRNHHVMWLIAGAALIMVFGVVAVVAASSGSSDDSQVSLGSTDVSGLGYTMDDPRRFQLPGQSGGGGDVRVTGSRVVRPRQPGNSNNPIPSITTNPGTSGRQEIGPDGERILPLTNNNIVSAPP